jgi:uncharacterized protein (TIGR02246 family)
MAKAREAIVEGYKAFEDAFLRGDADTISQMYTEDGEWFVPGAPVLKGRKAIAEGWGNVLGSGGNTIRVEVGEIQESEDWAYDVGKFTATAPGGRVLNAGKYIVVWKQQPIGEWKIHRDIFNWDIPPSDTSNP